MKGLWAFQCVYSCIYWVPAFGDLSMHMLFLLLKDSCSFKWNIHCTINHNDLYADSVNTSCYGILDASMNKTGVQHKKNSTFSKFHVLQIIRYKLVWTLCACASHIYYVQTFHKCHRGASWMLSLHRGFCRCAKSKLPTVMSSSSTKEREGTDFDTGSWESHFMSST